MSQQDALMKHMIESSVSPKLPEPKRSLNPMKDTPSTPMIYSLAGSRNRQYNSWNKANSQS